ncbi:MAG: hypothetical protein AAGC58_04560 [Asticcacaulis sp.]
MIDREKLISVTADMHRLINALESLPKPIVGGRAAALGTLAAIHKRFDVLASALEGREAKAADRSDIANAISSLKWLSEDKLILAALPDDVTLEDFDNYSSAIGDLINAAKNSIG